MYSHLIYKKYILFIALLTTLLTFSTGQSSNLGTVCAESNEYYGVRGFFDSEFIWAVEDGGVIIDGNGEDTIEIQWGYRVGDYNLEVVEVTSAGCMGIPVMGVVSVNAPLVDIGPDFIEVCEPDSIIFDARGDYFAPYIAQWHDGSYSATYKAKETELIWVRVTDSLGCVRYDSVDFSSHPLPEVYLGNDTLLCDEENPLPLNAGEYAFYEWESSSGLLFTSNPYYMFPPMPIMDTMRVTVTDIHGCQMSDTIVIYPCDIAEMFKGMPNTITPNGDMQNDVWIIPYIQSFPNAVLEIFDRWGRLVHHEEDFPARATFENIPGGEGWDGKSKGRDMPMDSYFYVLELNYMNIEPITGTINLIK